MALALVTSSQMTTGLAASFGRRERELNGALRIRIVTKKAVTVSYRIANKRRRRRSTKRVNKKRGKEFNAEGSPIPACNLNAESVRKFQPRVALWQLWESAFDSRRRNSERVAPLANHKAVATPSELRGIFWKNFLPRVSKQTLGLN